ncbi:MAG: hypothetical protein P1U87_18370 [Verrucomicrobiales bacterium]|nr:hypothetical protein [Verrucomicrobiales bacterium]
MANRRNSKLNEGTQRFAAKLWEIRFVLLMVFSYLLLFGWLFSGEIRADLRPTEVLTIPDDPLWKKPDAEHWFGTTGTGADLFQLSRVAMATTLAISVVVSGIGVGLTFLVVMMFAFDPGERRFSLLKSIGRTGVFLPAMVVVIVLAGGAGGSLIVTVLTLSVLVALHLSPTVAGWLEEGEERVGTVTGYILGLTRPEIVSNRIVPQILRRLIGVFVALIPPIALAEMGLSFLGLAGGRLSCGDLISRGQEVIIEAPWMAVCPGILATLIVVALALLGWFSSRFFKTGILPRWI